MIKRAYKLRTIVRDSHGRIIHAKISFRGSLRDLRAKIDGAQEAADAAFQRYLMAAVPLKSGNLRDSIPGNTTIGTGEIVVGTAYGHFQNFLDMPYKHLRKDDTRYVTDPNRGSHFIERTIEEHGDDVIAEAQQSLDGRSS